MQEPRIATKASALSSSKSSPVYVDPRNVCNPGFHTTTAAPLPTTTSTDVTTAPPLQPYYNPSYHHHNKNSCTSPNVNMRERGGASSPHPPPPPQKYRLEAEDDAGDCEYKWRLVGITSTRFEHLVTQMNFRISEGQGKCLYEIGVHDDGTAKGLDDADFEESVGVVKRMAGVLSLDVEIVAVQDVTPTIAELLHEQREYLASRRTALEGLLSRNSKMMYPTTNTGVVSGAAPPTSSATSSPASSTTYQIHNNSNTVYHQPFHFQKQYERRHEELSEALQSIVTQQAAADEEAKGMGPPSTMTKTTTAMTPTGVLSKSVHNSSLQQVLAAPLVQPKRMRCAEILVTRRPAQVCDVRVVMCGEEGAGKSTLVGVLTRGALDDGNGAVRSSIFSHRHELFSGKTSTIASHAIGFDAEGFITNYEEEDEGAATTTTTDRENNNNTSGNPYPTDTNDDIYYRQRQQQGEKGTGHPPPPATPPTHPVVVSTQEARSKFLLSQNTSTTTTAESPPQQPTTTTSKANTTTTAATHTATSLLSRTATSLAEKSVKLVTLLDIGGSGQYSRTAFFGLTARNPGYVSLVIDASKMINDEEGMGVFQTSSTTLLSTTAHNAAVNKEEEEEEEGEVAAGGDTYGAGFLSDESDCTTTTHPMATTHAVTSPTATSMTPMMRRLDSCIGQYIAICCVAKIPFFLILTKVDDVCELEMDDFLYEVDNYIAAITSRFDRREQEGGDDEGEEESAIKTLVVSVPEHLSHRDLVAGGNSNDPSRKSATETVLRAVIGCVTRSCVPVFLASSVSGAGLGALRAFFHQLPVQYGHQAAPAQPQQPSLPPTFPHPSKTDSTATERIPIEEATPPTEILIEGAFFVPARNVGVVLAGVVLRGCVRVGQHLRLGPDRFGGFYDATVLSIHTQPDGSYVSRLGEGSDGTFAIGHYGCDFCVVGGNKNSNSIAKEDDTETETISTTTTTTPNVFELICSDGGGGGGGVEALDGNSLTAAPTYAITSPTTTSNNCQATTSTGAANFRNGPHGRAASSSPPRSRRSSSSLGATTTREPSTETVQSHGSSCCNTTTPTTFTKNTTTSSRTFGGGDPNTTTGHPHRLLHPHLIRPLPLDQIPALNACYQHHRQTSPILNNNASTKKKEALLAAHLVQTFPVSSFFFGRKGTVLVSPLSNWPSESSFALPTTTPTKTSASYPTERAVTTHQNHPDGGGSASSPQGLCFRFECRLHLLPSRRRRRLLQKEGGQGAVSGSTDADPHTTATTTNPTTDTGGVAVGQEPVVHCRNIRQAARIDGVFTSPASSSSLKGRTQMQQQHHNAMFKVCNVVCQFLYFPEVLSLGATVLLRCGQAISAVGTVVFIHPLQHGTIAPKSPTLRAARYPLHHNHQLPLLLPPPTTLLSSATTTDVIKMDTDDMIATFDQDPLLQEIMKMEEDVEGGGDGNLALFADDDDDRRSRKQPQKQQQQRRQRVVGQAHSTSSTSQTPVASAANDDLPPALNKAEEEDLGGDVGGAIDPERRRLEHECRRLSRAERRARHYALILSHKCRKEEQKAGAAKKRVSDDFEGGSSSTAATTMGGRHCSNYSYYSSTATATPPPTPDTTGGGSGGGTWANYQHPPWHHHSSNGPTRRGDNVVGPSHATTTSTTTTRGANSGNHESSSGTMMTPTITASPPQSPDGAEGGERTFMTMSGNQPTAEFLRQDDDNDDDVDMM